MNKKLVTLSTIALMSPVYFAFAQGTSGINRLLNEIGGIINQLIPIIIGLAVVGFLWGLLKYMFAKNPEDQAAAKSVMFWGIVILFVMVAVWGLVNILIETVFGRGGSDFRPPSTPTVNL